MCAKCPKNLGSLLPRQVQGKLHEYPLKAQDEKASLSVCRVMRITENPSDLCQMRLQKFLFQFQWQWSVVNSQWSAKPMSYEFSILCIVHIPTFCRQILSGSSCRKELSQNPYSWSILRTVQFQNNESND